MSDTKSSRASSGKSGTHRGRRRNSSDFAKDVLSKSKSSGSDPKDGASEEILDDQEPLSLAEEIIEEGGVMSREPHDRYEKVKQGEIHIAELQKMSMSQLIEEARRENVTEVSCLLYTSDAADE